MTISKIPFGFGLDPILLEDEEHKTYTAYFAQFPDIIADGDTPEDTMQNLRDTFVAVMSYKKKQVLAQAQTKATTASWSFEMA